MSSDRIALIVYAIVMAWFVTFSKRMEERERRDRDEKNDRTELDS